MTEKFLSLTPTALRMSKSSARRPRVGAKIQLYHTRATFVKRKFEQNFFLKDPVFCALLPIAFLGGI